MEHSLIIELAACLFCFRWNCVHKEDRWTWCGICMASPRRVWERRSLGAKPAGLGSAATEIKLFGNMQLRPGSFPSLSLRHFPSTKGLDFSAVWCILHPDRYLRKTHFCRIVCTIRSECAWLSAFKAGLQEGLSPSGEHLSSAAAAAVKHQHLLPINFFFALFTSA